MTRKLCPGGGADFPPGIHPLSVVICPRCFRVFSSFFGLPVPRHFVTAANSHNRKD